MDFSTILNRYRKHLNAEASQLYQFITTDATCSLATKKSPFAVYPQEKHFVIDEARVPNAEATFLIEKNIVSYELDFEIIKILNTYVYITSKLLMDILNLGGFHIGPGALNNRLKRLSTKHFIRSIKFQSEDGTASAYKVFALDIHGRNWLFANDISVNMRVHNDNLITGKIKQVLCANQLTVALSQYLDFANINVRRVIASDSENRGLIRPTSFITLKDETNIIIEGIRRTEHEDWEKCFAERLLRYEDLFAYKKELTIHMKDSVIVLVGEDEEHMREISKILSKTISTNRNKYLITCDWLTNITDDLKLLKHDFATN